VAVRVETAKSVEVMVSRRVAVAVAVRTSLIMEVSKAVWIWVTF
jgi:hypothetical protein